MAIADGYRESTGSWADLLRDAKRRGMRAPVVMVGDGALGMWAALRDVFPETAEQRCWVHAANNVLNALPKSAQPAARRALTEIRDAEDRAHAESAIKALRVAYGTVTPLSARSVPGKPRRQELAIAPCPGRDERRSGPLRDQNAWRPTG